MKLGKCCFLAASAALLLAGCSPDEVEVEIPMSAIQRAKSASIGEATVTVVFTSQSSDVKSKIPQIREAVTPYLGKDGRLTVRSGRITTKFTAPVVSSSFRGSLPQAPLARLVLNDNNTLQFQTTSQMEGLTKALKSVDSSFNIDLNASHFVFRMLNDDGSRVKVRATAVFVDEKAYVNYEKALSDGESVDIEFRCDSTSSIYNQIDPFVEIVR